MDHNTYYYNHDHFNDDWNASASSLSSHYFQQNQNSNNRQYSSYAARDDNTVPSTTGQQRHQHQQQHTNDVQEVKVDWPTTTDKDNNDRTYDYNSRYEYYDDGKDNDGGEDYFHTILAPLNNEIRSTINTTASSPSLPPPPPKSPSRPTVTRQQQRLQPRRCVRPTNYNDDHDHDDFHHHEQQQPSQNSYTTGSTPPPSTTSTTTYDRLDEAERQLKILESNVVLHKRMDAMDTIVQNQMLENQKLQISLQTVINAYNKQQQQMKQLLQKMEQHERESSSSSSSSSRPNNNNNNNHNSNLVEESSLRNTSNVTWTIPSFEKTLTTRRHFYESSRFTCGPASLYLTVCILEVNDHVPEAERPVAIFIKSATGRKQHGTGSKKGNHYDPMCEESSSSSSSSSIFPLRLDGSSITLVGNKAAMSAGIGNKTIQVAGETAVMDDPSQGKGVRQFTTLGTLRDFFLQKDASVIVKATVRVPYVQTYQLTTQT
jgi:hypothetical protein